MSIAIGLIVLAVLIGFVCYTNRSPIHTERFRPKDILDQVDLCYHVLSKRPLS